MKLKELGSHIVIDSRKLTQYALNPESERGRHKALVFERVLGYTRENYEHLLDQIQNLAPNTDVRFHSQDQFGRRYVADLEITGPESQRAVVRTGWLVPNHQDEVRLVTLWVSE